VKPATSLSFLAATVPVFSFTVDYGLYSFLFVLELSARKAQNRREKTAPQGAFCAYEDAEPAKPYSPIISLSRQDYILSGASMPRSRSPFLRVIAHPERFNLPGRRGG
jgi:hypothetical protein